MGTNFTINDQWTSYKEAHDYRSFIKLYVEQNQLSLASFARAAGFGRGFPGDVISGKRRLTFKSCYAFEKAMRKLPPLGKKYFRMLVASEEADIFPALSKSKAVNELQKLKEKSWARTRSQITTHTHSEATKVFAIPECALIFAASGSPSKGASLSKLNTLTMLSPKRLRINLDKLIKVGLIKYDNCSETYSPTDLHLFIDTKEELNIAFKSLFSKACSSASARMPKHINSDEEFYFTSHLCISEKDMPELKQALKNTILQFVDNSISESGDKMVQLTTAFHK